ncbi:MAG: phosphatidylcholine/phosphatidylserine synthase, partial [Methylobacterium mesophilicum]|nr:phosphatidylcholine/phosphatidylserine synthase [Methylobacterium mesophilicum]
LAAAFLDGIDGRLARALRATSRFGAQMDSLADIVNFGVAPALVLYAFVLDRAGAPGWIAALLFAIACGLRLARFNVLDEDEDRPAWEAEYFVGVPAPAGAALVLFPIYLVFLDFTLPTRLFSYFAVAFTVLVAFLLVSRLPVWSGKTFGSKVRRENVLPVILAAMFYVLLLVNYPWSTLSLSVVAYLLFLPLSARAYAKRRESEQAKMLPHQ